MSTPWIGIENLDSGGQGLPRRAQAAFFSACAEGLFELYEQMERESGFGNSDLLRQCLETSWQFALGSEIDRPQSIMQSISELAPHGDDVDAPASTFAQDVVICVDCAISCATDEGIESLHVVQYAFEPIIMSVSLRDHGVLQVGESAEEELWEESLGDDPLIATALSRCREMIAELEGQAIISLHHRVVLQDLARNLLPPGHLLNL